jgi:hypothetical protein
MSHRPDRSAPRRRNRHRQATTAGRSSMRRTSPRLGFETLEDRTLLAVTSQLTNGVLDVALGAANDAATISVIGGSLDVFNGSTHVTYSPPAVQAINVHGNGAANQKLTLHSAVNLAQELTTSQLATETIDGSYQAASIALNAAQINVNGGVLSTRAIAPGGDPAVAPSTGNSGNLTLGAAQIQVMPGSKLLAHATGAFMPGSVTLQASDTEAGENVKSQATITVNGATITGGDVLIDASSKLTATAAKVLDALGANIANLDVSSTATVLVNGASQVTGSGNVTISAHSDATTTGTALALSSSSDTAKDAAFAKTAVTSTAVAHVGGSAQVTAGGTLSVAAVNGTKSDTTADGSVSGANAGGATVAIANVTANTEAFADGGSSLTGGQIQVSADSNTKASTTAKATAKAVTQNTASTQGTLAGANANSSSGPISLAASVGVLTFQDKTQAFIASSAPTIAPNGLQVSSTSTAQSNALADAGSAAPNGPPSGEGVAVAVQHGTETNRAYLGGTGGISAKGIGVTAGLSGGPNSFSALADSGISQNNSSAEGAAAFNIASSSDEAYLAKGSMVNAKTGDLMLKATGDVTSNATAQPAPGAIPGSFAKGMGASLTVNILADKTRAEIEDGTTLTNTTNLTMGATAHEGMTTVAEAGADPKPDGSSFPGFSAAVGIDLLNATTTARIGAGPDLNLAGGLTADATHKAEISDTSGGTAAGPGVIGAAFALTVASSKTTTSVNRNLGAAGDVVLSTHADLASGADAHASARGGKAQDANTPANAVDGEAASQLGLADKQAAAANVPGTNGATAPKAQSDGGGATAAGALAIDLVTASKSEVSFAPNINVQALGGNISLTAGNDTDAHAKADGATTDAATTGVGVAIAINAVTAETDRAFVGANTTIQAKGLSLQAMMDGAGDGTNTFGAEAVSGAGAKETGFAGSLGINLVKLTDEAFLNPGVAVTLSGGDLTLSAAAQASSVASAMPGKDPVTGDDKGIGVSAAFNIVQDSTRAEVSNTASATGAGEVHVVANSTDTLKTDAETGAQSSGGTAFAGSLSATALNSSTKARLGTGSPLAASGSVHLEATHVDTIAAEAGGTGKGATKAIGVSIGFTYDSADTTAMVDRDLNAGGDISVSARSASASDTVATASETGGKDKDANTPNNGAKQQGDAEKDLLNQEAAGSGVQGTSANTQTPDAKTSNGDSIAVAGALAIDIVGKAHAQALIGDGHMVNAGGALSLVAMDDVDAHTKADGSAVGQAATGVGVAIALTIAPDVQTTARIGANDVVSAHGVNVTAGMSSFNDFTHVVGADATSGASASDKAGAGGLALAVFLPKTSALVNTGASLDLGGGSLNLSADEATTSSATAAPTKDPVTGKSLGVGLAFGFDIVEPTTTARVANGAAVNNAQNVTLTAHSVDSLTASASAGAAASGGGSGTAITGSGAAAALTANTSASLGTGPVLVTQNGGAIDVEAAHKDMVATTAGADSKGDETAVGLSIALSYESVNTTATTNRDINAAGAVTFAAHNASSTSTTADASGTGGPAQAPNGSSTGVKDEGDATKSALDGNAKAGAPNAQGVSPNTQVPDAKNTNGDSLAFAGALALDLPVRVHSLATIPDGRSVHAGAPLTLHADNDLDASAKADGSALGQAKTGVGVAVAITVAPDEQTYATIGKNDNVSGQGVTLSAGMSPDNDATHVVTADAISGASATDSAGAGGFGLVVFLPTTTASVGAGTSLDAGAGDVAISATEATSSHAMASPTKDKVTGKSLGVGISLAFDVVEPTTTATVADGVVVSGVKNVTLAAQSTDSLAASASAGASASGGGSGTGIAASVAASALTTTTTAALGSGQELFTQTGGAVTVQATHKDTLTTTAGADSKGDETAVGVSIAVSYESVNTTATTNRDIEAAGAVTFAAHNASSTSTTADASGSGGPDKAPNGSPTGVKDQGDATKSTLNTDAKNAAPGAKGMNANAKIPDAKNADGKSVAVAGAIALDLPVQVHSLATVPDGRSIHAGGKLTVHADGDTDASAVADGTAVGQATTGVGVAVAITVAPDVQTFATLGAGDDIEATGVEVSAGMSPDNDQTNDILANATSGASASNKAGAGAFAMDIFLAKTGATVGQGTTILAGGGNVAVSADEATQSTVNAVPSVQFGGGGGGGGTREGDVIGVGVAVALNIVEVETHAGLSDGVNLAAAHDVALSSQSTDQLQTKATAGAAAPNQAKGSTGIGAEAALSVLLARTQADIGANGSVTADNDLSAKAQHVDTVTTFGDGFGSGSGTAVGVAIGFTYVDAQTNATLAESVTAGGAATFEAKNATSSNTMSTASAKGGGDKDANTPSNGVDVLGQKNRKLADSYATGAGGQSTASGPANPQAKTSDGSISVAGALAINVVGNSKAIATTADNQFVHAGGPVTVAAANDTDAAAGASGTAVDSATTGVGIAIALNIAPHVETTATVGENAVIQGKGITISAGMSDANDQQNVVAGTAISGASASKKGGAGGLGLSVFLDQTNAAALSGAHMDAKGGDVAISAVSTTSSNAAATTTKGAGGKTIGVGVSVAVDVIEETTRAEIQDGVVLDGAHGLTVSAASHDGALLTAEAGADAPGGDGGAGAATIAVLVPTTAARIGIASDITTTGAVTVAASHTGDSASTIDSNANGADTVVGIAIGVDYLNANTTADVDRNLSAGDAFTISAHTETTATASAKASAKGGKGDNGNAPSNGVDQQANTERDYANGQITSNGGQATNNNENTQAKTSEGGISVAGALGLNIVHVHSDAILPDGLTIGAGGPLVVSAWNDASGTAAADGQATGQSKTGVGAAIAINYIDAEATGRIGVDTVDAHGVTVEATQGGPNNQETYAATAISGAGAKNTGIAGAVALNLVLTNTHDASIASGASVDAHAGDVSVLAASTTTDTSSATPADGGADADNTGVGASVAVNIVLKKVRAEVEDNAKLFDAGNFTVDAASTDALTTTAKNGAQGDTAVGISAAVLYIKNDTHARVGTGPDLSANGDATIHATIDDYATTTGDSAAVGSGTAVGLTIAVGIVRVSDDSSTANASLSRSLTAAGAITITTDEITTSDVKATASSRGMPEQVNNATKNSDDRTKDQFNFADSLSGQNDSGNSPSLQDNEDKANSQTQASANSKSKDSTGVAAAIGVNVELVRIGAYVAPGLTVSGGGLVQIGTTSEVSGSAEARGVALTLQQGDSTTVSAAVAVNVPIVDDHVLVGAGATIHGQGIAIRAEQAPGTTDDFTARALSGAGGTGDAGAGAAGLIVAKVNTTAIVDPNATLNSTADLDVSASNLMRIQNVVGSVALADGTGVGLGITLNLVFDHTTVAMIGQGATVDALGALTVSATASLTPISGSGIPGDPSGMAVGAAGSTDTTVGGSIIVDVISETTHAEIGPNSLVNTQFAGGPVQSVAVTADDTVKLSDWAGGIDISGATGVGAGLVVTVLTTDVQAIIDHDGTVNAGGDVIVAATSRQEDFALGITASIADNSAVSLTAVVLVPNLMTTAFIGLGTHVTAMGNVAIVATDVFKATDSGGSLSGGGSAGVGAEVAVVALSDTTEAYLDTGASVTARGQTQPYEMPNGAKDALGNPATDPIHGFAVTAVAFQDLTTFAVGGAVGGSGAVSGSAAVDSYGLTTKAYLAANTSVDATNLLPGSGPSVHVLASDLTSLTSAGGALAVSSGPAVGLGVDVGVITKDTEAYIQSDTVQADTDVIVAATSSESFNSFSVSGGVSGNAAIVGAAGVYVINVTTRAYIGSSSGGEVDAGGSVEVAAREALDLLMVSGGISASSAVSAGAAAGIPIITKTTEAYIGADCKVNAEGLGNAIDADTGQFSAIYTPYGNDFSQADPGAKTQKPLFKDSNNQDVGLTKSGQLDQHRTSASITTPWHGVAVTASNRDALQVVGASGGFAGSAAINVSGAVDVITNHTLAHVDQAATINKPDPIASNAQSVRVAAGNDFSFLGIAAGLAASSSAAITAAATVLVANETTIASVADGASLLARGDIDVEAHASEDLLTVAATGSGSGGASVGGSASVVVVNDTTQANIGQSAASDAEGAKAIALGNVIVAASDDTNLVTVAGGLAIGGVAGFGAAVAVSVFDKNTAAFVGDHATVVAAGLTSSVDGVYDGTIDSAKGTFNALPTFHGLAVQAESIEDVTQVGVAAGIGVYVGLGGGVSVEIYNANTFAYIGAGAKINQALQLLNTNESVNVAAVDSVHNFTLGIGAGGGIAGIGAGIDVGILRNNTAGWIGEDAEVFAHGNIDVIGLSNEDITTYGISGAAGFVGAAGSVSVWSIGTSYSSEYHNDGQSDNAVDGNGLSDSGKGAQKTPGMFKTATGTLLDGQNPLFGPAQSIGNAKSNSDQSIDASGQDDYVGDAVNAQNFQSGTSAEIHDGAQVHSDSGIGVRAADRLIMNTNVGTVAVGAGGFGASVSVVGLHSQVHALVDPNVTLQAGSDIFVTALFTEQVHGFSLAGTGGIVAIAGQVVLISDDSVQEASLGANDSVVQANNVEVIAGATRSADVETIGVDIGGVAAGVTYLEVGFAGSTTAEVDDGVQIGQDPNHSVTGSLVVAALDNNTITDKGFSLVTGAGAGSGHHSVPSITPTISATIGDNVAVTVGGGVLVDAVSLGDASADLLNIVVGALSVNVMISETVVSPSLTASVGNSSLDAGGSIDVFASHNYDQNGPVAGLGAHAHSEAPGGGGISGTGVSVKATANATVHSLVAAGATLHAGGEVGLSAKVSNLSDAQAVTASLGVLGIGGSVPTATADGDAEAFLDGTVTNSSSIHVGVAGTAHAGAEGTALGVAAGGSAQGAFVTAEASPTLQARIGNGSTPANVTAQNDITTTADSDADASAQGHTLSLGLDVSLGVVTSTATMDPTVSATVGLGSHVSSSLGLIQVAAAHNLSGKGGANALGEAPGGGFISGNGAVPTADASATVTAQVAPDAVLSSRGGIAITADATNLATATASALSLGVGAIGTSVATATANGATSAYLDGNVDECQTLDVTAKGTNVATTNADATSGALAIGGAGVNSSATANPTIGARIGIDGALNQGSKVKAMGDVTLGATSLSNAEAHGFTAAIGGLAGIGIVNATATATPQTSVLVGKGATVESTGGNINIYARHNQDQRKGALATAQAPAGGGLLAGDGATPTATSTAVTKVFVGDRVTIKADAGDVGIHADATGLVEADADTLALGALAFGTVHDQSTSDGETRIQMDGQVHGNNVMIAAFSIDDGQAHGTSATGGIVGGVGVFSETLVDSTTIAQIGDLAASGAVGATGQVTLSAGAQETSKAEAEAVSIGALFSLGLSHAQARMTSEVGAVLWDGNGIVTDGSISVAANLGLPHIGMSAEAHADSPGGGLISGTGAIAEATATPTVYARANQQATLNAGGDIGVTANSRTDTNSDASSLSIGAASFGASVVNATSSAKTTAVMLGKVETGQSLTVSAVGDDQAVTTGTAAVGGIVAGDGTVVTSTVKPQTQAELGTANDPNSVFTLAKDVTVNAHETAFGTAESGSLSISFLGGGIAKAESDVAPFVDAHIADGVTVDTAGGNLSVTATFDGPETQALAHATGDSGLGGYQSTQATVQLVPLVGALVGPGASMDVGGDATVEATSHENASTTADGSSLSLGVGAGGTSAHTTIGGDTLAATVNVAKLVARGNILVTDADTSTAQSHAVALGGGVLSGVAGSDANSTIARTVVADLDANGGPVIAFGMVLVDAQANHAALSTADGTSVSGGVSVGVSNATANSSPTVKALIGPNTLPFAVGSLAVIAGGTNDVEATSNSSAGGVLGGAVGSNAIRMGNIDTEAHVSAGDSLHAGTIDVEADGHNEAHGEANGDAGGIFGGGSQVSQSDLYETVIAMVDDAGAAQPNQLVGPAAITIQASGDVSGSTMTEGGSGGAIGAGGAEDHFLVHSPLVRAYIGNNTSVQTSGNLQVLATDNLDTTSTTHQDSGGLVAGVEATADAEVTGPQTITVPGEAPFNGELVLADLGQSVQGTVGHLVMHSTQGFASSSANAGAFTGGAGATSTANTTADLYTNSIVHVAPGTDITAASNVDLTADGAQHTWTTSHAHAQAVSATVAHANATAGSEKHSHDCVIVEPGATFSAMKVNSQSGAQPPLDPGDQYDKSADAVPIAPVFIPVSSTPGSQTNEACADWNAFIKLHKAPQKLHIDATGRLLDMEGLMVFPTGSSGPASVGDVLTVPFVVEADPSANLAGSVDIEVPGGDISGHATITYDQYSDLEILNDSPESMTVDQIDTSDGGLPTIITNAVPGTMGWSYDLAPQSNPATATVSGGSEVFLVGTFSAPTSDVTIRAGEDFWLSPEAQILAGGAVAISGDMGSGVSSDINIDGFVQGTSLEITMGDDPDVVELGSIAPDVAALDVLLGAGEDFFSLAALAPRTAAMIEGGAGDDTFQIGSIGTRDRDVPMPMIVGGKGINTLYGPDSNNTWEITKSNTGVVTGPNVFQFIGIQSLRGGARDDLFLFDDGASVDGLLDGGYGTNTIEYSPDYSTPVTVDFSTESATGIEGGTPWSFTNIDVAILPDGTRKHK